MLKYEHISPGQKIRAYDFEPFGDFRDGLYVEGIVLRHEFKEGAKFLVIEADVDTSVHIRKNPNVTRVGKEVFVPMETAFFEWDGRVVKINEMTHPEFKVIPTAGTKGKNNT